MEPGIYDNITNDDYHKGPGISKSGLDLIAQSPAHYYHAVNAANDNEPTAAQAFGTAFHTLLLEPEVFWATYAEPLKRSDYPNALGNKDELIALAGEHDVAIKKSAKVDDIAVAIREAGIEFELWSEIKARHDEKNQGRVVLSEDDFYRLIDMRDAVMAHPAASYLMNLPGKAEQSVYWNDPKTGVLCRCRPDYWTQSNIVVDLKTCVDASPEGFAKSIYNWRYHVQDVMYRDGIKIATGNEPQFVFLAVEKGACVVNGVSKGVAVYQLDLLSREAGALLYRANLGTYAQCSESGKWPGYHNFVQEIAIPAWGLRDVAVE